MRYAGSEMLSGGPIVCGSACVRVATGGQSGTRKASSAVRLDEVAAITGVQTTRPVQRRHQGLDSRFCGPLLSALAQTKPTVSDRTNQTFGGKQKHIQGAG